MLCSTHESPSVHYNRKSLNIQKAVQYLTKFTHPLPSARRDNNLSFEKITSEVSKSAVSIQMLTRLQGSASASMSTAIELSASRLNIAICEQWPRCSDPAGGSPTPSYSTLQAQRDATSSHLCVTYRHVHTSHIVTVMHRILSPQ